MCAVCNYILTHLFVVDFTLLSVHDKVDVTGVVYVHLTSDDGPVRSLVARVHDTAISVRCGSLIRRDVTHCCCS